MTEQHINFAKKHIKNVKDSIDMLMHTKYDENILYLYASNDTLGIEYVQLLIQRILGLNKVSGKKVPKDINTLASARKYVGNQGIPYRIVLLTFKNYLTVESSSMI